MRAFVISMSLLLPLSGSAFDLTGAKWRLSRGETVSYVVNRSLSDDMTDPECLAAVNLGYDAWTDISCSFLVWQYGGRTDNDTWGNSDGENVVSWREGSWDDSPAALAITSTVFGGLQNALQDADIKFNGFHHGWADVPTGAGNRGGTDVASVSAHEVGHALGLGHSNIAGSTMWPSTGPGDASGRSLGADDIDGVCSLYPSGGEIPEPDMEPEVMPGTAGFGDTCFDERCQDDLFCLNDGRDLYCSRSCTPGEESCGAGYYCAYLSGGGGGACVRGEDPRANLAGFGEDCGQGRQCQQGLVCVNDSNSLYCTGPCTGEMCPTGYFCVALQDGGSICAQGTADMEGPLPEFGAPCTDRGFCADGLFCLNDPTNIDETTGRPVSYCTRPCENMGCEAGFQCVDINPSGTACRRIPTSGERNIGDECWVNPERPWERPTCSGDLICADFEIVDQVVVEPGYCTQNCTKTECCPNGWGCLEITPRFGQCQEGRDDSPRFVCEGARPDEMDPGTPGSDGDSDSGGSSGGCTSQGEQPLGLTAGIACLIICFTRRRWSGRNV